MTAASRSTWLLAVTWVCIVAGVAQLAVLSQRVERTPDELNYQLAGRVLVARQPLTQIEERFQGPLILVGTQLTDTKPRASTDDALRAARLGMVVFPAVLMVVLAMWSAAALGAVAGAWVAFLAATSPALLAYGPLLSSDVAFTAMALLTAAALWRWLRAPGAVSLVGLGIAVGAVAATKYTAVLVVAAVVPIAVGAVLRGLAPWPGRGAGAGLPARLAGLALAFVVVAGVALVTLHAAYLFASPRFASVAEPVLRTPWLQALATTAPASWVVGLLPEPFVLGLDYASVWAGVTTNGTFGATRGNHWAYYPLTVVFKTPLVLLVTAALGLVVAARQRDRLGYWACVLVPPLAVLLFCSATRALQMGVRYVLPVVPAMWVLAAVFLARPWRHRRLQVATASIVIAASLFNVVTGWPHFVGFFNVLAGGQAGGWRLCADGNCDWNQRVVSGRDALLARHTGIAVIGPGQGPRLGRVAVEVNTLLEPDPFDSGSIYHWLRRFEPVDHEGASWFLFEVTPESFAAASAAGDPRASTDLALAWLERGEFDRARAALPLAAVGEPAAVARIRGIVENAAIAGNDPARRDMVAHELEAVGDFEQALAWLDRGNRANRTRVFWLHVRMGRPGAGLDWLEAQGADGSRTTEEVVLLAAMLIEGATGAGLLADPRRSRELMQRGPAPTADSPWRDAWSELERRVAAAIEREAYFRDK